MEQMNFIDLRRFVEDYMRWFSVHSTLRLTYTVTNPDEPAHFHDHRVKCDVTLNRRWMFSITTYGDTRRDTAKQCLKDVFDHLIRHRSYLLRQLGMENRLQALGLDLSDSSSSDSQRLATPSNESETDSDAPSEIDEPESELER